MSQTENTGEATPPAGDIPPEWVERDAKAKALVAAEEAEKEQKRVAEFEKLKATLGIPRAFLALVDGPAMRETDALSEVKKGGFEILVLAGAVGRGKSVAAAWWLLQAAARGERHKPLFVTAARLSRWERYDNAEMDKLLHARRLVIDDLGNEYNDTKGNFLALLDEVIADRVASKRPTILTTNLPGDAFVERYGQRVRDRIRESGRFQEFAGDSYRVGQQLGLLPAANGIHQ